MGVTDPMQKVWVQQHRGAWNQNVLLQSQLKYLSPEALNLLDRMFDMDENRRYGLSVSWLGYCFCGCWGWVPPCLPQTFLMGRSLIRYLLPLLLSLLHVHTSAPSHFA